MLKALELLMLMRPAQGVHLRFVRSDRCDDGDGHVPPKTVYLAEDSANGDGGYSGSRNPAAFFGVIRDGQIRPPRIGVPSLLLRLADVGDVAAVPSRGVDPRVCAGGRVSGVVLEPVVNHVA